MPLEADTAERPDRLTKHEELTTFFEKMVAGLAQLGETIDRAISGGGNGAPEPLLLGKAGELANNGGPAWSETNAAAGH